MSGIEKGQRDRAATGPAGRVARQSAARRTVPGIAMAPDGRGSALGIHDPVPQPALDAAACHPPRPRTSVPGINLVAAVLSPLRVYAPSLSRRARRGSLLDLRRPDRILDSVRRAWQRPCLVRWYAAERKQGRPVRSASRRLPA